MITKNELMQEITELAPEIEKLTQEYRALFVLPRLTDEQSERMSQILDLASKNRILDFWISHATTQEGGKLGLNSKRHLKSYEDQKSVLREYLCEAVQEPEKESWTEYFTEIKKLGGGKSTTSTVEISKDQKAVNTIQSLLHDAFSEVNFQRAQFRIT